MEQARNEGYLQLLEQLFEFRFAWSDVWKEVLRPLGYEVEEIILNSPQLQQTWARDHGETYSDKGWKLEILCAQMKKLQPDVIFLDDYAAFSPSEIRRIRAAASSVRLLVGWCGAPYEPNAPFREFDLVLSNISSLAHELRDAGNETAVLQHAFDTRIVVHLPTLEQTARRITFCGTISKKKGWHDERAEFVDRLTRVVPCQVASHLHQQITQTGRTLARICASPTSPRFLRSIVDNLTATTAAFPSLHLAGALTQPLAGLEMYEFLAGSTATFNMHIGKSATEASNMRLFEAAGVGACLLTDRKQNLQDFFEPDYEVVAYDSLPDCIEKACWLMENPERAREIGLRAQKRTNAEHTFVRRAIELDTILKKRMTSRRPRIPLAVYSP